MSHKKLKPDPNQLPLTKFVDSSESQSSKKRKNPCEGISPNDKVSPPYKKVNPEDKLFNMTEEDFTRMENKLSTNLTASLSTSLSASLSASLKEDMKEMIDSSLAGAIATMNDASARMTESSNAMNKQNVVIKELQEENKQLNRRLFKLETANKKLTNKMSAIESRSLENNIVFRGISDEKWEKEASSVNKVYGEIGLTIAADNEEERQEATKRIGIRRCRRLGKFVEGKSRPLSVEFSLKQDVEYLLENKNNLREGIYIDREYPIEIEYERKVLRPILKAARKIPAMEKKCKLEGATLHIKGRPYTVRTLHKLPKELNVFKISSKTNADTVGFYGQLNPLSNFHYAQFTHEGITFHSSEQWIQYQKALFASDIDSCNKILATKKAIECKLLSHKIEDLDTDAWDEVAKSKCKPGIAAKFTQNPRLMESLLRTKNKTIVECAKNTLWGTGYPLSNDDCLQSDNWVNQGILGEILEEIREEELRKTQRHDVPMVT